MIESSVKWFSLTRQRLLFEAPPQDRYQREQRQGEQPRKTWPNFIETSHRPSSLVRPNEFFADHSVKLPTMSCSQGRSFPTRDFQQARTIEFISSLDAIKIVGSSGQSLRRRDMLA